MVRVAGGRPYCAGMSAFEPGRRTIGRPWCLVLAVAWCAPVAAIPPLVSGDVPTAEHGTYELFVGYLATDSGPVTSHQIPFWELVYGITRRQELTIEAPLVLRDDPSGSATGLGDAVLGTKVRFLGRPSEDSGLSASLEITLPTGDRDRGLGSGAVDVDLRARAGRQISREVVYGNVGHTWVGEDGDEPREDTWFFALVWDHPLAARVRLLTEVYEKTADEPGAPDRLAATIGTKMKFREREQIHLSVGRSLRSGAAGGPDLRVYAGWRRDF